MIDQIILSSSEHQDYIGFWEPVAIAYRKIFPTVKIHLAFLSNRREDDPVLSRMRQFGEVTLFRPTPQVQEFAQAKLIRFILAARQGADVCYIDDIDLFPLKKSFITNKTMYRPKGHIMCVGGEVYKNNGCYPVSQMTAEGYVWKEFINPEDSQYKTLLLYWSVIPIVFDQMEYLNTPTDWNTWTCFSDEKFLRKLRHLHPNPPPVFEIARGYEDHMTATVDRSDWSKFNQSKLDNHEYENAHGRRPYSMYKEDYEPLIKYVNDNY